MSKITPSEFAQSIGSDPRTVRKFLRSNAKENGTETPGKGSRWEIDSRSVPKLRKGFKVWNDARTPNAEDSDTES